MVAGRNRLYDKKIFTPQRLACPVISVGNITVGGTGKTPCVTMLVRLLQDLGFRPAVVSRGYGGKSPGRVKVISDGRKIFFDAATSGDEPLLLGRSLPGVPVITGARRSEAGRFAVAKFGANIIVCDDAFQHRKIARDVDIVLLDGQKPFGNGKLLPAGPLREPPSALKRADCFIITRTNSSGFYAATIDDVARKNRKKVFLSRHLVRDVLKADDASVFPPTVVQGKSVCAFCGIARPETFKQTLLEAGANIVSFDPFPDHYRYGIRDIEELENKFMALKADFLLTTEKDAVRLEQYPEFMKLLGIVRLRMDMAPSVEPLKNFLLERLESAGSWN